MSKQNNCPHCGAIQATYHRRIDHLMIRVLAKLSLCEHPLHQSKICGGPFGNDYAKLRYWGLVSSPARGYWDITDLGRQFLRGEVSVPEVAVVKRSKLIDMEGPQVFAKDCVEKFNLEETLGLVA